MLAGVISGFIWLFLSASAKNPILTADSCPVTGPTEQLLVLVDVTDPIGKITQTDLLNHLGEIASGLGKGGRFELRVLEPGTDRTRTLFSACNPGNGSDLDHWTGNPDMAKRRWSESFDAPLKAATEAALSGQESETSPLMAAIQQISVDRLGTSALRNLTNRLVIVSDMLENTEYFSMYRSGADFAAYEESDASRRFGTDLANTSVELWFIRRQTKIPSASVAEFWLAWTLESGGQFSRAIQLQGLE